MNEEIVNENSDDFHYGMKQSNKEEKEKIYLDVGNRYYRDLQNFFCDNWVLHCTQITVAFHKLHGPQSNPRMINSASNVLQQRPHRLPKSLFRRLTVLIIRKVFLRWTILAAV